MRGGRGKRQPGGFIAQREVKERKREGEEKVATLAS